MAKAHLTPDHFARSPMAVPPLARDARGALDERANAALIRHIEAGGITLLLYGGNANVYHLPLDEYEPLLDMLGRLPSAETLVVPAAGPTFGLLLEHARAQLANYKRPKAIECWKELPKSAANKILRREIRDRIIARDAGT